MPAETKRKIAKRSRETPTHYAWCLIDEPDQPVSLWINEYKDPGRWPASYANSVHNHRYDFCTRVIAGGYHHENYRTMWDAASGELTKVTLYDHRDLSEGEVLVLPADSFHRISTAKGGTLTLLVKSRPRFEYSMSYDPAAGTTLIHVPIEARVEFLIDTLASW